MNESQEIKPKPEAGLPLGAAPLLDHMFVTLNLSIKSTAISVALCMSMILAGTNLHDTDLVPIETVRTNPPAVFAVVAKPVVGIYGICLPQISLGKRASNGKGVRQ